jgi:hypothetical protein
MNAAAGQRPQRGLRGAWGKERPMTQWSVGIEATGDRIMEREQIVELADAVAIHSGIASGIGNNCYGAKVVVEAATREEAVEKATELFRKAAERASLPLWPVTTIEAMSEHEIDPEDW